MKHKLFTLLFAVIASLGTVFAQSGTCGDNLTWNLSNGVLIISGTGEMKDYMTSYPAPWYSYRTSVQYVVIGNGVTSIGNNAFYNCDSLTSVTIPNSVTSIGISAFSGCHSLLSLTIPNSVTSIKRNAFYTVPNIIYNGTVTGSPWGARSMNGYVDNYLVYTDASKTKLLACSAAATIVTIPNSVASIGEYAFYRCRSLISITIPNGVPAIEERTFYGCNRLESVILPNTISTIGVHAFDGCNSLSSINIPNTVTSIGEGTFSFCRGLTSVMIPNSVTSIGDAAFYYCSSLTSVTIPNSVTSIGERAFASCSSMISIDIADSNPNYCSVEGVIFNKEKSTLIQYPGGKQGDYIIPTSVTSIENSAFRDCSGLTSVTIPNSVIGIGSYAFSGCSGLTSVSLPNSVTSIGSRAFEGCSSLTSVSIGNSVTSIGSSAFFECISLTSVTIPISVTSIGDYAFEQCSSLTNIYLNSTTPPTIRSSTFYKIPTNAIVHVLFGGISAYKNSSYWKDLNIQGPSINQEIMPLSTSCSIRYDVDGVELQSVGISGGEQQPGNVLEYIDLEPNSEYKDVPVVLTSNTGETETVNVSFTTTALELTTKPSKAVSATTAILLAETNMSDAEVSCGFEYKRNDAPADMAGTKVFCPVANGQMAGRLKNLKDDVYYKYRAFYQSAAGNMYYGDWQYIFTGDVAVEFDPILYTYGATVVKETEATICGYALAGSEDFTEQGFEYWAETRANGGTNAPRRMPAALNEHFFVQASGISLRVTLTDLDAGTVYKYRVYGKVGDQYYYGSEQAFTTTGTYTPPTYTITFANWDGATLQSSQVEEGTLPIYTGATPERPEDEQYIYTFNGWSPAVVAATADATYTATYTATPKSQGIEDVQGNNVQCTKVVRDGQIFILRGEKVYNAQGALVK